MAGTALCAPLITHHSSYKTHHTPLITHYSAYTTHHTPLILHHSSHTTHHAPLITHYSSHITHLTPFSRPGSFRPLFFSSLVIRSFYFSLCIQHSPDITTHFQAKSLTTSLHWGSTELHRTTDAVCGTTGRWTPGHGTRAVSAPRAPRAPLLRSRRRRNRRFRWDPKNGVAGILRPRSGPGWDQGA